jgi:hypothetical protein
MEKISEDLEVLKETMHNRLNGQVG